jgi:hypothetical protein
MISAPSIVTGYMGATCSMVGVVNSTPEPDGSFKNYFLGVHPELRPLPPPGVSAW